MADLSRFLPLSQRRGTDDAGVSGDRRGALAEIVTQAAGIVAGARASRAARADTFVTGAGLRHDAAALAIDDPVARLTALAAAVREGRRRSIRSLASGARALLLLAREAQREVALAPMTAGAVALYAATTAPLERRAVVRGHTVRASDADWAFGHGPLLSGPATGIAAFLLGVSDDPPRPDGGRRPRAESGPESGSDSGPGDLTAP